MWKVIALHYLFTYISLPQIAIEYDNSQHLHTNEEPIDNF